MRIFNYELRRINSDDEIRKGVLDRAEENAKSGLAIAQLDYRHHSFLLEQSLAKDTSEEVEREVRLNKEAVERDLKSINNWKTQLKAINYERI